MLISTKHDFKRVCGLYHSRLIKNSIFYLNLRPRFTFSLALMFSNFLSYLFLLRLIFYYSKHQCKTWGRGCKLNVSHTDLVFKSGVRASTSALRFITATKSINFDTRSGMVSLCVECIRLNCPVAYSRST